jgi:hypothetical protein
LDPQQDDGLPFNLKEFVVRLNDQRKELFSDRRTPSMVKADNSESWYQRSFVDRKDDHRFCSSSRSTTFKGSNPIASDSAMIGFIIAEGQSYHNRKTLGQELSLD